MPRPMSRTAKSGSSRSVLGRRGRWNAVVEFAVVVGVLASTPTTTANSTTAFQRPRRPRTLLLLPLLAVLLIGLGIAAGFFASTANHPATNSTTPTTTTVHFTPVPTARPMATPNPVPPNAFPNVNG